MTFQRSTRSTSKPKAIVSKKKTVVKKKAKPKAAAKAGKLGKSKSQNTRKGNQGKKVVVVVENENDDPHMTRKEKILEAMRDTFLEEYEEIEPLKSLPRVGWRKKKVKGGKRGVKKAEGGKGGSKGVNGGIKKKGASKKKRVEVKIVEKSRVTRGSTRGEVGKGVQK